LLLLLSIINMDFYLAIVFLETGTRLLSIVTMDFYLAIIFLETGTRLLANLISFMTLLTPASINNQFVYHVIEPFRVTFKLYILFKIGLYTNFLSTQFRNKLYLLHYRFHKY
jgi:hypothetical protein